MRRLLILSVLLMLLSPLARAQDDGGFLTRTIEDALSGAGREVSITGFSGALSSEARFDRMTIADGEGVWLTLENVVLNWRRTALLRGRLEVDRLRAELLNIERLPIAGEDTVEVPAAEAEPFTLQLPELPVTINIAEFAVAEIALGEPVIGTPARLSLTAAARFDDAGLDMTLAAQRIDDVEGLFDLRANVARDGAVIDLALALEEAPGGIAARLLNLPDLPSVDLEIAGTGPLDDFATDIRLATDGAERLAGQVALRAEPGGEAGASPDRRILATLGGDITALIAPEYRDFFGPDVGLDVDTLLRADGAVAVEAFSLAAAAVEMGGTVTLTPELWPDFIDINGRIARNGENVVLPGTDAGVSVSEVLLDVYFDAAEGDVLAGRFDVSDLIHEAARIDQAVLIMDGVLSGSAQSIGRFAAHVALDARGVALSDEEIGAALGDSVQASAGLAYRRDAPFEISNLTLRGPDFGLTGDVAIADLGNGFPTDLVLDVSAEDLSRFAGLAGQAIAGSAELSVAGNVVPLSGMFDLAIEGRADDLAVDIPQADAVLAGRTELSLAARRDTGGTFVEDLRLQNPALDARADVALRSGSSEVTARVALGDIALVLPDYQGAVLLDGTAQQVTGGWWQVDARLDAPYAIEATVAGLATGPQADLDFALSMPDVQPVVPEAEGPLRAQGRVWQAETGYMVDVSASGPFDAALEAEGLATGPEADLTFVLSVPEVQRIAPQAQGPLDARGRLWQAPEGYMVDVSAGGPFGADLDVAGLATGPDARVTFAANLPDMGALVPELAGALALTGEVARSGAEDWAVATRLDGPGGMVADVEGTAKGDGSALDMAIRGEVPLALAGPFLAPRSVTGPAAFDLALRGPPALASLSGTVTTRAARFNDPSLRLTLQNIETRIDLARSVARLNLGGDFATGGRLRVGGSVDLASLAGDLAIALERALLIDPNLYAATVDADVTVQGPLTGGARIAGRINLGEVNVTVPGAGSTSVGGIPEIRHVDASSAVNATRDRAGVIPKESAGQSGGTPPVYPLAIDINAPSRIFIRGRGLNAEVGGALSLRGTTANVISSGSFDLIRGRFDVIGKRFDLDEGSVQFQGSLTPYIRFVTTTEVPDGTASIAVEGLATEPEITFSAVPEVPEDEVLSLILFGRYVSELSAFQALQLANGVAQITGRGGVNVIGNLQNSIGLDELDVTTGEDGSASVTAGKYITENIYTDVTTNSEKGTDISLNIDLTRDLTGKATVAEDGDSSIGLFFERDY